MSRDLRRADTAAPFDPLATDLLGRPGSASFSVSIGPRYVDRLLARVWGLRDHGPVLISLAIAPTADGQRWTRGIDGRCRTTTLRWDERNNTVIETFGPMRMTFAAATRPRGIRLDLVQVATVLGPVAIRVPRWALPQVIACTRDSGSGLWVRVEVRNRRDRTMLAYEGTLP